MSRHLNLISYFGGKYPHLNWLIDQFPKGDYHFVDIMCGAANVALNVDYPLVTINDLNDEVVNLFHVLRTREEELTRAIYFTPFSKAELYRILDNYYSPCDEVERARRYFVRCQLGYGANGSQNTNKGVGFEFKIDTRKRYYRVDGWYLKLERLSKIAARLRELQIESRNALELFDRVNTADCVVYFDPEYSTDTWSNGKRYKHQCDEQFHRDLAEATKSAKCYVAVSGYDGPLYRKIFKHLHKTTAKESISNTGKKKVQECLWTNYVPEEVNWHIKAQLRIDEPVPNSSLKTPHS